jgi:hypothetical protein
MRTRTRNFPGTDGKASARMMRDVDADEQAAIAAIKELRRAGAISFEAIAFMLGTGANQISRYPEPGLPVHDRARKGGG